MPADQVVAQQLHVESSTVLFFYARKNTYFGAAPLYDVRCKPMTKPIYFSPFVPNERARKKKRETD